MLTEPAGTQRKQKGSGQAGVQRRHGGSLPVSASLLRPWQTQQMGSQQGPGSQQVQALLVQDNDPASRSLADRGTQNPGSRSSKEPTRYEGCERGRDDLAA